MQSEEEIELRSMLEQEFAALKQGSQEASPPGLVESTRIARHVMEPSLEPGTSVGFHVASETKGRVVILESGPDAPRISLTRAGEIEYCIDHLKIAKRAVNTMREGNSYFLRTNSEHGLLSLSVYGDGVRLAFVDGAWIGDVAREPFLNALTNI